MKLPDGGCGHDYRFMPGSEYTNWAERSRKQDLLWSVMLRNSHRVPGAGESRMYKYAVMVVLELPSPKIPRNEEPVFLFIRL